MILGLEIGSAEIKAGLVSESGELIRTERTRTPDSLARFGYDVRSLIGGFLSSAPRAIGIGCSGIVNPEDSMVEGLSGRLNYLEGRYLAEFLPANLPIYTDNDARAALAGEMAWGVASGRSNAILLMLGDSVTGAVLADGKLLRGASGAFANLGHYTLDPLGPMCSCGNSGCLETYFSIRAIEAEAAALVRRGASVRWAEYAPSCEEIFQAAGEGDPAAGWIVERAIRYLEGALAGLVLTFDPEVVVLGGPLSLAGDLLFRPLSAAVSARTSGILRRSVPIVKAQVADVSGVLGAAALCVAPEQRAPETGWMQGARSWKRGSWKASAS